MSSGFSYSQSLDSFFFLENETSYDFLEPSDPDNRVSFHRMLFLALFGAAVLAVYLVLALTGKNVLFTEILSIVGSFSLWEAADALLLERPHLRREYKNNEQNLKQKIEFVPPMSEDERDCGGE